ncbi:MAG: osmoprotectant NAGGN system M42 family peptidase [Pseudobdellovibrionaceae bacterium]|nr:osmoprotectant NAGGN system M42 family peptidase [Pseudobdellovibrionaceae bacterium]
MNDTFLDKSYLLDTLAELLAIPSPSGYTDNVVHYIASKLEQLNIEFELTRRGAIRANIPGKVGSPDRGIVAHIDTLGAMVKALKDNGRLEIVPVGSWSSRFAEGGRVAIFKDKGFARGTILPLKASGHTFNEEIDQQPVAWTNVEVRIDEFVTSKQDLIEHGFHVGDYLALDPGLEITSTGFINSRYLDNKAGAATLLAAAKAVVENKIILPVDCHLLFTISEEVGVGASAVLHGDVAEMVSIDNSTPAPGQNSSDYGVTIAMKDSSGPFDWHLTKRLIQLCQQNNIEHSRDVFKYYRCDAASAVEAGNDLRTALICFAADGSHGYERTHVNSLLELGKLIFHYIQSDLVIQRDRKELSSSIQDFPRQPFDMQVIPPNFRADLDS